MTASSIATIVSDIEVLDFSSNAQADTLTFTAADVAGVGSGGGSTLTIIAGSGDTINATGYDVVDTSVQNVTTYVWTDGTTLNVQAA